MMQNYGTLTAKLCAIAVTLLSVAPLLAGGCKTKTQAKAKATPLSAAQACASGDMHQCNVLGDTYEKAKEPLIAAALYQQACTGKDMNACGKLGLLYAEGTGVAADLLKAAALFEQACTGGVESACDR